MNTPSKLHTTRGLSTTCVDCGQNIIEARSEVCPGPPQLAHGQMIDKLEEELAASCEQGTAAPQLSKPQAPRDPDIYARAARSILGMSTEPNEYVRVTMCASTRQWLRDRMAALRLDVLIERKHLLRERGPRADLHDRLLETLEHDLIEINRITDALL